VHAEGRRARARVENAREQVAQLVGALPSEVVFTSSATEANNHILRAGWNTIFFCGIEHESVLVPACTTAAQVHEFGSGASGAASIESLKAALAHNSARGLRRLVTLQMANNETGVVQPLAAVADLAQTHGLAVHSDATQAAGRVRIRFAELGIEAMSLSSHKIGGPHGVGALIIKDGSEIASFVLGGGQERRRRAGTENVAGIAGFGAAAAAAMADIDGPMADVGSLRDRVEREIKRLTPEAVVIGSGAPRLANTACISVPGCSAETLVIKLDLAGVAVSAGSACSSGKTASSHVLTAMGLPEEIARGAIRISLGTTTTAKDIDRLIAAWAEIVRSSAVDNRQRDNDLRDNRRPHKQILEEA
jgi:cysteine desulfurase